MTSVRRSLALSFAEKYSSLFIQFGSTLVLARLLSPGEIGVFSVGMAVVGVAHSLRDFGVTNYLIQQKELTPAKIATAFGVSLVIAWGMAALLAAAAGPVAGFYAEPELVSVMLVMAASFAVIPFGAVTLALLRRDMNFAVLFRINTASALAHAVTAIALAAAGVGPMSLAWAGLAGIIATVAGGWLCRPALAWLRPGFQDARGVFAFGSRMTAVSVVNNLGRSAPDLAIGRLLGFAEVGLFSRAIGLVMLFEQAVGDAIRPVVLPFFSARLREGHDLKRPYLYAFDGMVGLSWPFFAVLALTLRPLILVLYGEPWLAAAPVAEILCLAFAVRQLSNAMGEILITLDRVQRFLTVQLATQSATILLVVAAAFFDLETIAWTYVAASLLVFALNYLALRPEIGLRLADYLPAVLRALGITVMVSAVVLLIGETAGPDRIGPWGYLLLCAGGATATWLAGLYLVRHPLRRELERLLARGERLLRS